ALLETLGRLHAAHAPVELARSFAPPVRPIPLPSYPWQREAHWLAPPEVHAAGSSAPSAERAHPLLRERAGTGESAEGRGYEVRLGGALRDHRVKGVAVAPAAAYLAAALGAAARGRPRAVLQIEELQLEQLATLPEQGELALDLQLESTEAATTFELRRTSGARLARGRLVDGASATPAVPRETLAELRARCPATLSAEGFYSASAGAGWEFGPAFRTVCGMSQGEGEALVRLELPDALAREASAYEIHPVLLDGCFQALGGATGIREGEQLSSTVLPVGLRRLRLLRRGAATGWAHARLRPGAGGAGGLEGEVTLYNDEGLPILEAEGLVVRTLEGLALSAEGLTHAVSWDERAVAELPASGPSSRRWLLVGEGQGLTERLAERLRGRGEPVVTALGTEAPGEAAPHRRKLDLADPAALEALVTSLAGDDWVAPTELVYLGALELGAASEERAFAEAEARGGAWLELVRAVVKGRLKTIPRVTIVSAGAHAVGDDAPPLAPGLLAQAVFAGLGATLALEHPELRPRQIDLSSGTPDEEELALLLRLLAEGGAPDRLAVRAGRCLAARLVPLPLASPSPSTPPAPLCRPEASYLVTGGLGGLGLAVASWLVEQGARRVCLLGRHGVSEPRQAEAIAALEGRGARVLVLEGDVADAPALVRVVETMEAELGPLGGVIHAAGLLENALLLDLDRQRLGRVWAPKVQGAWNLHLATRDRPLDFFVLFSSMAALLGAPGQGNYAAANAFLEALGPARRRAGLPATVIAWSAWAEIGAAARALASGRFALLDGSRALLPAEALATLGQILSARAPQVAVFSLDLPRLVHATRGEAPAVPALLRALLPEARPGGAATPRLRDELLSLEVAARDARLEEYLTSQVARTLGLPAARIDLERPLQELGLDSRLAILLKNQVNRDLGEVLPIVRLVEGPSLAGLRRIVLDELGRGARAEPRPLDLEAEGRLPDDLVPAGTLPARFAAPRTLLLTGATGFLGGFLVAELLAGADLQLVCLVRAASDAEALGRVKAQLEAQGLWRAGFEGRLSAVAGDLAAPRFGLAPARYEALAGRVDEVLHNGARIDLVLPYEALRDANVGGTLEALRLALHGRVRPLHYVSTLAIFQADAYEAEPRIFEDAPLLPATGLVSGYMQTKWVSERLLEAARARGLPVTVLRPGLISGDSILGRTDRDGWFRLLLAELLGRQVAPAVELPLNLTPVDYVARAIARLVLRRESLGHAFHLFNPTSGRLEQVLAFVAQKGHAIQRLPLPAWRELVGGGAGQPAASLFAQLLPALLRPELVIDPEAYDLAKKIDGANAARGLEGSGIACPRLDETLLETYFAYLGRQGWLGS
ncbi:MAG: thioester reductase domain-containing protein, partial [Deltaproteobacteria bacterium]|nr:thioester reductase domain-containing protein [Deltaproteobacteria bacterium]